MRYRVSAKGTMSCWVVPSIAAEIWGMSLQHVLDQIEAGELATYQENDWLFVDVYPDGPVIDLANQQPLHRPPTYTAVSDDELAVLRDVPQSEEAEEHRDDPDASPDPEPEVSVFTDWRSARRRTSRLRLAPPRFAAI